MADFLASGAASTLVGSSSAGRLVVVASDILPSFQEMLERVSEGGALAEVQSLSRSNNNREKGGASRAWWAGKSTSARRVASL